MFSSSGWSRRKAVVIRLPHRRSRAGRWLGNVRSATADCPAGPRCAGAAALTPLDLLTFANNGNISSLSDYTAHHYEHQKCY
jgi:hypothetical protein